MKWLSCLSAALLLAATALAQEPPTGTAHLPAIVPVFDGTAQPCWEESGAALCCPAGGPDAAGRTFLAGNHGFDNFIGFMSNPLQNIDPRAVTELWPIVGGVWFSTIPALPSGNFQLLPSAGLNLALSERLSVGLNQGGYAVADFENEPGRFRDRLGRLRDRREFSGDRSGWLNLGGFGQYTLIEDVPDQFILTAGLRWEAPSGSKAIFQGNGPAHLAPYLTVGKECGKFHVLATVGYQFPTGSGDVSSNLFYANVHLDRQVCGWLYPLVEFNTLYHTTRVDVDVPTRRGFIDFNNFESSGNIVTLAVGVNAVLIRNKLEIGGCYSTPIATRRNFDFDGYLVKAVLRY
jgi:hypothetical protein